MLEVTQDLFKKIEVFGVIRVETNNFDPALEILTELLDEPLLDRIFGLLEDFICYAEVARFDLHDSL